MCGIVGFTTPGQDPAAAKQIVQGMADLIRHRGPDGEGCYADGTAALGHRRLSVIDLAGGGQPMLNEDGTLVVVFNGEIYNYKTLRARLQQRGHTFATDSDTEVLLHGYEEWGRDLPCRLRGMFAFAVWDRTRGTLFCARDLFGIKPLCYYKKGETLLFASEIKAFLAHPAFEKRLNEARLPDWLSMEYLPDDETLFTGVYELPPAHTLTWQAGRVTLARYAAPRFRAKRGRSLRAWAREIGDAVAESADAHRIADVEVGCFLSGGVDSSLITCEMARRQPAVQCFSVGYAEEAYSELPAARAAAQALGVPLTETTVTADDFFAANRAIQWYLDEPMPNPAEVPLYFLCRTARQRVKVVLSGEGADELFGGYPLYRQAVWAERWQKMPRAVRRALAALLPGCGKKEQWNVDNFFLSDDGTTYSVSYRHDDGTEEVVAEMGSYPQPLTIIAGKLYYVHGGSMVAVDGFRLAFRREKLEKLEGGAFSFVCPGSALSEVKSICGDTEDLVTVTLGKRHILFEIGDTQLICRRLEGEFLDYKNAIPRKNPIQIVAETKALIESIDRVSVVISDKLKSPVRCLFDHDKVMLSAKTGNGEAKDVCHVSGDGDKLEIGFNNRYLMEALRYAPADKVKIELNTGVSPAIIVPVEGEENFLYMVLPVRLKSAE